MLHASSLAGVFGGAMALILSSGLAQASPGDLHRISGERVNLRAAPSDEAAIRSQVVAGQQLLEVRREGGWLGVRVLPTGEEGWVFANLTEPLAKSQLLSAPVANPLTSLSDSFARLIASIGDQLGYPLIAAAEPAANGALRVRASEAWLLNGGRDAHVLGALALYEMWKRHQNGRPVSLALLDSGGRDYISIRDLDGGPRLAFADRLATR